MACPGIIEADWPAPASVTALCTTRAGGASAAPFDSFNLAEHVGDAPGAVRANRQRLRAALPPGSRIQWLQQVHGIRVVRADAAPGDCPEADASWTRERGLACAVMTADCLPVLFCDRAGTVVAAAHAGWRGLAGGVLEATVAAMEVPGASLMAWLGPAIGPAAFEVGAEVREAFYTSLDNGSRGADVSAETSRAAEDGLRQQVAECFRPAGRPGHFLADLYALARLRLARLGVAAVYGGGACTWQDAGRFYSYRRDGRTGRMASLVLLNP
jgi:purine-nucleoside/S-methyl-5'-thioadenosine phosphorylase / adenosine deaminase